MDAAASFSLGFSLSVTRSLNVITVQVTCRNQESGNTIMCKMVPEKKSLLVFLGTLDTEINNIMVIVIVHVIPFLFIILCAGALWSRYGDIDR